MLRSLPNSATDSAYACRNQSVVQPGQTTSALGVLPDRIGDLNIPLGPSLLDREQLASLGTVHKDNLDVDLMPTLTLCTLWAKPASCEKRQPQKDGSKPLETGLIEKNLSPGAGLTRKESSNCKALQPLAIKLHSFRQYRIARQSPVAPSSRLPVASPSNRIMHPCPSSTAPSTRSYFQNGCCSSRIRT